MRRVLGCGIDILSAFAAATPCRYTDKPHFIRVNYVVRLGDYYRGVDIFQAQQIGRNTRDKIGGQREDIIRSGHGFTIYANDTAGMN